MTTPVKTIRFRPGVAAGIFACLCLAVNYSIGYIYLQEVSLRREGVAAVGLVVSCRVDTRRAGRAWLTEYEASIAFEGIDGLIRLNRPLKPGTFVPVSYAAEDKRDFTIGSRRDPLWIILIEELHWAFISMFGLAAWGFLWITGLAIRLWWYRWYHAHKPKRVSP